MSDTPRTDALLLVINEGRTHETESPMAIHARQLERELAEVKVKLAEAELVIAHYQRIEREEIDQDLKKWEEI